MFELERIKAYIFYESFYLIAHWIHYHTKRPNSRGMMEHNIFPSSNEVEEDWGKWNVTV